MKSWQVLAAVALACSAGTALAQIGAGAGGVASRPLISSQGGDEPRRDVKKKVDDEYAHGRAILAGKGAGMSGVQVCVKVGDQLFDMHDTRTHELRAFAKRSALGAALHDCAATGQPSLSEVMGAEDVAAVTHFLDKRLELDLQK